MYGGGQPPVISFDKRIARGDSCNTLDIVMTNHTGTHIDMPAHFVEDGRTLTDYQPEFWFSNKVACIFGDLNQPPALEILIGPEQFNFLIIDEIDDCCEVILFKTGFGTLRGTEIYWKNPPGIDPDLPDYLRQVFPNLRFFGMDLISVSSFVAREKGRQTHKAFLDHRSPILPIEDMNLTDLPKTLSNILVAPLYLDNADGAPCTVFGNVGYDFGNQVQV